MIYLGGEQLIIKNNFLSNVSSCGNKNNHFQTKKHFELNNGRRNFIIKEMEVYSIVKN